MCRIRKTFPAFLAAVLCCSLWPAFALAQNTSTFETYYTARQDYRKCAWPLCGGYFIKAVNKKTTVCADGTKQAECYVTDVNLDALELSDDGEYQFKMQFEAGQAVARGVQSLRYWSGFGRLPELHVSRGDVATSENAGKGYYVMLRDNGIVCITYPCNSIDETILNTKYSGAIWDLDLSKSGATEDEKDAAYQALQKDGLVAYGYNQRIKDAGPAGDGIRFVAFRFYLQPDGKPSDHGCEDLAGIDFGWCDMNLGWAVVDGRCQSVSGCDDYGYHFFANQDECVKTCVENWCESIEDCGLGQYCMFEPYATCRWTGIGTCVDTPDGCFAVYDPVCSCDQITYGNACEAARAGVSIFTEGACE